MHLLFQGPTCIGRPGRPSRRRPSTGSRRRMTSAGPSGWTSAPACDSTAWGAAVGSGGRAPVGTGGGPGGAGRAGGGRRRQLRARCQRPLSGHCRSAEVSYEAVVCALHAVRPSPGAVCVTVNILSYLIVNRIPYDLSFRNTSTSTYVSYGNRGLHVQLFALLFCYDSFHVRNGNGEGPRGDSIRFNVVTSPYPNCIHCWHGNQRV